MNKIREWENRNPATSGLLGEPEYFHCKRFSCRMKKEHCVERQEKKHGGWKDWHDSGVFVSFPECQKCEQGSEIRAKFVPIRYSDVTDMRPFTDKGLLQVTKSG